MKNLEIVKKLILKIPDDSELTDAVKVFLKAFEITDSSRMEEVEKIWKLIKEEEIDHFIIVKSNEKVIGCRVGSCVITHTFDQLNKL